MTNEQKGQVREALVRYVNNFETQSAAADSLHGISSSTISQVKNHNWELLSDRLWHHIARQVGFYCGDNFRERPADTSAYLLLRILFSDAQHYAMTYGISVGEGLGKTFTAGHYIRENSDAFYITCNEHFNRRSFLNALMNNAGVQPKGTVPDMMQQYTDHMTGLEEPVLIVDDAHKLKDRVLHLVILLANKLAGKAGIVIMGCDKLRMRITEGVRMNKPGFDSIYQSIGRRFITLGSLGPKDIELVCRANGVYAEDTIRYITEQCSNLHAATHLILQQTYMKTAA